MNINEKLDFFSTEKTSLKVGTLNMTFCMLVRDATNSNRDDYIDGSTIEPCLSD